MKKKLRKRPKQSPQKRSLEEVIERFSEVCSCERCRQPLVVHAYSAKNRSRGLKEKIYAHCENSGEQNGQRCSKYNMEICFIEKFF